MGTVLEGGAGGTKVGSRKAGERSFKSPVAMGQKPRCQCRTSTRAEAWGRVAAAHKGAKVSAKRKTRRDLCSKWPLPNAADFGQAQARQGDTCKELWDHPLLTKPGTTECQYQVCVSIIKATLHFPLQGNQAQSSPHTPGQGAGEADRAYPQAPSLRRESLHLYQALLWSATLQQVLILT